MKSNQKELDDTFARFEQEQVAKSHPENPRNEHDYAEKHKIDTPLRQDPEFNKDSAAFYMSSPRPEEGKNPHNQNNQNPLKANANKILSKSSSMGDISQHQYFDSSSTRPKLGMGYEEGREFYENLHARRSKGLAPATKYAYEHYEIEDSLRNRETARYGENVPFPSLNDPYYHRGNFSRRSYNPLTNDMYKYTKQQL